MAVARVAMAVQAEEAAAVPGPAQPDTPAVEAAEEGHKARAELAGRLERAGTVSGMAGVPANAEKSASAATAATVVTARLALASGSEVAVEAAGITPAAVVAEVTAARAVVLVVAVAEGLHTLSRPPLRYACGEAGKPRRVMAFSSLAGRACFSTPPRLHGIRDTRRLQCRAKILRSYR